MLERLEPLPTPGELRYKAELLQQYIGPYYKDVYLTALDYFPGFKLIRQASLHFYSESNILVGGVNSDGEPSVHIGLKDGAVTSRIQSRIIERFDMPDKVRGMPSKILLPIIFAHELGHILQAELNFCNYFGELSDIYPDPDEDYAGYVESDKETNADYIAALLIGNSEYGLTAGIMPPDEEPAIWRLWADRHPVPLTVEAFKTAK